MTPHQLHLLQRSLPSPTQIASSRNILPAGRCRGKSTKRHLTVCSRLHGRWTPCRFCCFSVVFSNPPSQRAKTELHICVSVSVHLRLLCDRGTGSRPRSPGKKQTKINGVRTLTTGFLWASKSAPVFKALVRLRWPDV